LKKIQRLETAIEYEHNDFNKAQLQKELDKVIKEREERLRKQKVEDKKAQLQEKISQEKEELAEKKKHLEEQKRLEIENIKEIYERQKENYQKQLEMVREIKQEQLEESKLYAEAERMLMQNSQEEILELLHGYGESYKVAGHTLGERLLDGIKPKISEIQSLIDDLNAKINAARDRALNATSNNNINYNTNDNRKVYNQHVTVNSPRSLNHSETQRQTEYTLRRMGLAT
ncbi:hypothetical protein CLPU_44c00010, partial [Gottschalkia purinilytica]